MAIVTSPTLLEKMKDINDNDAWNRFYRIYSPLIIGYCQQHSLSKEFALDVLQETMVRLLRLIPDFNYNPGKGKFSALLLKIVHGRMVDAIRRQHRYCSIQTDSVQGSLHEIKDPMAGQPCKEWDELWKKNLLLHAIDQVKEQVDLLTFESFKLNVLEEKSINEVCRILAEKYEVTIKKDSIYQHKTRVLKLVKKRIKDIDEEIGI